MRRGHWCHWCLCFQEISAEEWHQTGLCLRWKATRNEVAGALSEVEMPLLALRSFLGRSQHTRLGQATRRWQHDLRHWVLLCARSLNNAGRSGRKQRQIARPEMSSTRTKYVGSHEVPLLFISFYASPTTCGCSSHNNLKGSKWVKWKYGLPEA